MDPNPRKSDLDFVLWKNKLDEEEDKARSTSSRLELSGLIFEARLVHLKRSLLLEEAVESP
jgi:hypothetical protein